MADVLQTTIEASLAWLLTESLDLSSPTDNGVLEYSQSLADGTGASQADVGWHDARQVAGSSNDDLDMTAIAQTIFGTSVVKAMAKIKALMIYNLNTVSGDDLKIDSSVSASVLSIFAGSATSEIEIPASGLLLVTNPIAGWGVTATTADILRITNQSSNAVDFRIAIIGTSA